MGDAAPADGATDYIKLKVVGQVRPTIYLTYHD